MKAQLEGSYNIQKIMSLENEYTHKKKLLKDLKHENHHIVELQRDQTRAIKILKKNGNYEKKFSELSDELKQAKHHVRRLQVKEQQDQKLMQSQHEQLIILEERARKLQAMIKSKTRKKVVNINVTQSPQTKSKNQNYTLEDLQNLEQQLLEEQQAKVDVEG